MFRKTIQNGTDSGNGGNGGQALGPGSQADGAIGHNGGDANGGDIAVGPHSNTDDMTNGIALDGGQDHPGCNIAIGTLCENETGR